MRNSRSVLPTVSLAVVMLLLLTTIPFPTSVRAAVICGGTVECRQGLLTTNETWTANKVYVLTGDLTIPAGITLTVQEGTVVKSGDAADVVVRGILNVNGTAANPVYFTSTEDDTVGGDTNNDGTNTNPMPDDWDNIQFINASGTITYMEVRFSGGDPSAGPADGAIYLENSSPTISNLTVRNGRRSMISAAASDNLALSNFSSFNTPFSGVEIRPGTTSASVTWNVKGIPYILADDLTVAVGHTLTLEPGTVVKLSASADLNIQGVLNAVGNAASSIVFTSIKDDTVSGDTNGDSVGSRPAVDDWDSIQFLQGSAGVLDFVDIKYSGGDLGGGPADGAIYVNGSSPTISNCVLTNNTIGLYIAAGTPSISRCDIYNNQRSGVFNNASATRVDARNNWWGSNQGPNDNSNADEITNISTRGQPVSDFVDYMPWSEQRTQSVLQVAVPQLVFQATAGGAVPDPQPVKLTNAAIGVLEWNATESLPWLNLTKTSGATPDAVDVSVDTSNLSVGAYSGTITFSSPGSRLTNSIIPVQVTVVAQASTAPVLDISANSIAFNVAFTARGGGANPPTQEVVIDNKGRGSLSWTASEDIPWLTLSKNAGVAKSTIGANVDITGLNEGVYRGRIAVTDATTSASSSFVDVTLTVGCISSTIRPADIMVVFDRSASMMQPDISTFVNAKNAARLLMDQSVRDDNLIGLTTFIGVASLEVPLTKDTALVNQVIQDLTVDDGNNSQSGTNIADAIQVAQRELLGARKRPNSQSVMVILSDGDSNRGGNPVAAAAEAKAKGIRVITVGLGNIDERTLRSTASSPSDYYRAFTSSALIEIYSRIAVSVGCPAKTYLPVVRR